MEYQDLVEKKITEYLRDKLSPFLIYLFGSYAKGHIRPDSDVDIAFLSDEEQNDYLIFSAAQGLADIIKRDIHLIDLKRATTVLQMQVVGTGKVIFCDNDIKRANFEMLTMKKYARLNEERQIILDGVKERGNIFG
jgi:predicted nucleotidyltransferase